MKSKIEILMKIFVYIFFDSKLTDSAQKFVFSNAIYSLINGGFDT